MNKKKKKKQPLLVDFSLLNKDLSEKNRKGYFKSLGN